MIKRKAEPAPPKPDYTEALAEYDLAVGDRVRFRTSEAGKWTEATVSRIENDGSIGMSEAKTHKSRSILPDMIERRVFGPRGGKKWVKLEKKVQNG